MKRCREMSHIHYTPEDFEAVKRFMVSARSIISAGRTKPTDIVTMALNESWKSYASTVDVRILTIEAKKALTEMAKNFPGFKPIRESGKDAVLPAKGKGLDQGKASGQMPAYKTGANKELQSKNTLITRKPKNNNESTPEISGSGIGYDGKGKAPKLEALSKQDPSLTENVSKLTKHIRKSLTESLRPGFKVNGFKMLVREGQETAMTPARHTLAEAVADAEELLLFHSPDDVRMLIGYTSNLGRKGEKMLEMVSMKRRAPIFNEGKALFRFQRNAELFARKLALEGYSSRLAEHNWGCCVVAESKSAAIATFKKLIV